MDEPRSPSLARRWAQKFSCATRGVAIAFRQEDSFAVHLPAAVAVVFLGLTTDVSREEFLLLVVCVAVVIAAELFNSALERLAAAVTTEVNPLVRDALDVASGAVLVAAAGAACVGAIVLLG